MFPRRRRLTVLVIKDIIALDAVLFSQEADSNDHDGPPIHLERIGVKDASSSLVFTLFGVGVKLGTSPVGRNRLSLRTCSEARRLVRRGLLIFRPVEFGPL